MNHPHNTKPVTLTKGDKSHHFPTMKAAELFLGLNSNSAMVSYYHRKGLKLRGFKITKTI